MFCLQIVHQLLISLSTWVSSTWGGDCRLRFSVGFAFSRVSVFSLPASSPSADKQPLQLRAVDFPAPGTALLSSRFAGDIAFPWIVMLIRAYRNSDDFSRQPCMVAFQTDGFSCSCYFLQLRGDIYPPWDDTSWGWHQHLRSFKSFFLLKLHQIPS